MSNPARPAAGATSRSPAERTGDRLRTEGNHAAAVEAYLEAATGTEISSAALCLRLARCYRNLGDEHNALEWAASVTEAGDDFAAWHSAAALVQTCTSVPEASQLRPARLALLGSYTTAQLGTLLRLAALRRGLRLDIVESAHGQYRQDIFDPESRSFDPDPEVVLLAVHEGEVALPPYSQTPPTDVEAELRRWTGLWEAVARRSSARVVQHNFAIPPEVPLGHLAARLPGSRYRMVQTLNHRLGEEAGSRVSLVDCDRLAAWFGKRLWFDARYWHHAKQAVALGAVPLLARHTAAVIAADLGLSRKCIVLDLDNTLWGGVVGEDGVAGLRLGNGIDGEAFCAFQEYLLRLKERGVILAVCSKNNEADAREAFSDHPAMRLRREDVAVFVANWESKVENLRAIARTLNIGLESLVFVDDNPAEREMVRQLLPEVDVVPLPSDPAQYTRCLSEYLGFESSSYTPEDSVRTAQYHAVARIGELEAATESLEDFHRSLRMQATIRPFDDVDLPRIAQLVGKSNQFNLTTRRHGFAQLQAFTRDPECMHFSLRLKDCFTDHGLVAVMIALRRGTVLDIDTWLMSCRVIGRTVEAEMLQHLCEVARRIGCTQLRGTYVRTQKNALVSTLYRRFGFALIEETDDATVWSYDIAAKGPILNGFIESSDVGRHGLAPTGPPRGGWGNRQDQQTIKEQDNALCR